MTKQDFEEKFGELKRLVRSHPGAVDFVQSLWVSREKVAFAFVQDYFTAGAKSSQRGESINSVLKENGSKSRKNRLKMMTIDELVTELDLIINHGYREDIELLRKNMMNGDKLGKFVRDYMVNEKSKFDRYKAHRIRINEYEVRRYDVHTINSSSREVHSWTVNLGQSPDVLPTCNCPMFTNMGLPCRHIAAALYTAAMHGERHPLFLDEKNIRPRWRYQEHPINKVKLLRVFLIQINPHI